MEFELLCKAFNDLTKAPDHFLSNGHLTSELKNLLKKVYDFGQNNERSSTKALPQLIIKDFDDEQIWQELELQNEDCLPNLINKAARLLVSKSLVFPVKTDLNKSEKESIKWKKNKGKKNAKLSEAISSEEEFEDEDMMEGNDDDFDSDDDEGDLLETKIPRNVKIVPSEVDDEFFKLSEMEAFLKHQEEEGDGLGAGIDLFNDAQSESEEEDERPKYIDFFVDRNEKTSEREHLEDEELDDETGEGIENDDNLNEDFEEDEGQCEVDKLSNRKNKKVTFEGATERESESSDDGKKIKSSFEIRQEKLKQKISQLEEEALQEKPWPLKGEVNAAVRPINSLLEEVVEFDMTQRPPPIITEETTNKLEDIIKQRIRDQAYDDVERKIKPVSTPYEFKKKLVLDQEKSKLSLAEVYEQEYLKQRDNQSQDATEQPEKEREEHIIIKKMMKSLFTKLDALSNFFFVPKPIVPELKIVSNMPAVQIEEVTPVGVSDAKLLAPEEVGGSFTKSLLGKEEKTKTDKKRERRKKKILQAKKFKAKALKDANKTPTYSEELKKVMKFKNVSKLEEKTDKNTKTSKDFFNKLQDEVQNQISQKENPKKRKLNQSNKSAKILKL